MLNIIKMFKNFFELNCMLTLLVNHEQQIIKQLNIVESWTLHDWIQYARIIS